MACAEQSEYELNVFDHVSRVLDSMVINNHICGDEQTNINMQLQGNMKYRVDVQENPEYNKLLSINKYK